MDIEGAEEDVINMMTENVAKIISQMTFEYHIKRPRLLIKKLKKLKFNVRHYKLDKEIFAYRNLVQ